LGLVSKRFPELHTTRTFEIPACGTALLTEYNRETADFYKDDEVIFFRNTSELIDNIRFYFNHPEKLQVLTNKGLLKVRSGGYDYKTQLTEICERMGILKLIK
jgi:spore maturation protein CgeB